MLKSRITLLFELLWIVVYTDDLEAEKEARKKDQKPHMLVRLYERTLAHTWFKVISLILFSILAVFL